MYHEFCNKKVKTRKPHKCNWCGEIIENEEYAIYIKGIYYGDFYSDHYHIECNDAILKSDLPDNAFQPMTQERGVTYNEH